MKRIVLFCDGTWNTPDKQLHGESCKTNVVKMAEALSGYSADGTPQLFYYDKGIGSEGSYPERLFDGATGSGITQNILQAYQFLIRNYEKGDELFFFGFSRGAFTVRSLAGLIRNSGILSVRNRELIQKAYKLYRSRSPVLQPRANEAVLFRKTFGREESTPIHFIGVWDTVGALGNPLMLKSVFNHSNEFHDTTLSTRVKYAYQALAIDEHRKNFMATLWHQQKDAKDQVLEQVWFPGVHSDVGGGFPHGESGLSDLSLDWMIHKATGCGLTFNPIDLHPDCCAPLHESYTGVYKLRKPFIRTVDQFGSNTGNTNETVHPSVYERMSRLPGYRPANIIPQSNL